MLALACSSSMTFRRWFSRSPSKGTLLMESPTAEKDATALALDDLVQGFPHIPSEGGAMMAQAAVVCLDHQAHTSAVRLVVDGAFSATFLLSWSEGVTEAKQRFWNDIEEATQQGASRVCTLLVRPGNG